MGYRLSDAIKNSVAINMANFETTTFVDEKQAIHRYWNDPVFRAKVLAITTSVLRIIEDHKKEKS